MIHFEYSFIWFMFIPCGWRGLKCLGLSQRVSGRRIDGYTQRFRGDASPCMAHVHMCNIVQPSTVHYY